MWTTSELRPIWKYRCRNSSTTPGGYTTKPGYWLSWITSGETTDLKTCNFRDNRFSMQGYLRDQWKLPKLPRLTSNLDW